MAWLQAESASQLLPFRVFCFRVCCVECVCARGVMPVFVVSVFHEKGVRLFFYRNYCPLQQQFSREA
jgi:hypothetical protein